MYKNKNHINRQYMPGARSVSPSVGIYVLCFFLLPGRRCFHPNAERCWYISGFCLRVTAIRRSAEFRGINGWWLWMWCDKRRAATKTRYPRAPHTKRRVRGRASIGNFLATPQILLFCVIQVCWLLTTCADKERAGTENLLYRACIFKGSYHLCIMA